jgi:hypothetical protein
MVPRGSVDHRARLLVTPLFVVPCFRLPLSLFVAGSLCRVFGCRCRCLWPVCSPGPAAVLPVAANHSAVLLGELECVGSRCPQHPHHFD